MIKDAYALLSITLNITDKDKDKRKDESINYKFMQLLKNNEIYDRISFEH